MLYVSAQKLIASLCYVVIDLAFLKQSFNLILSCLYRIDGVMVSVLVSNAVDRGFEPRSGQNKEYAIGICCFSAKELEQRLVGSES
jgi:hypothetical protein